MPNSLGFRREPRAMVCHAAISSDFGVMGSYCFFGSHLLCSSSNHGLPNVCCRSQRFVGSAFVSRLQWPKIWGTNPGYFADTTCKTCSPHFIHFVWTGFTYIIFVHTRYMHRIIPGLSVHLPPCWSETSNLYFILYTLLRCTYLGFELKQISSFNTEHPSQLSAFFSRNCGAVSDMSNLARFERWTCVF